MQHPDYQYIQGILNNDTNILKEIYEKYLPGIIKLVKRNNGGVEEAKDIFQHALLIIYEKAQQEKFTLTASFFSYLYSISRFLWLRQLKKKHRKDITLDGQERYIPDEDIERLQAEEERWQLFRKHFKLLGTDCQKVLQLFFDGNSMKDIAEKLEYTVSYVKLKKYKCKEQLVKLVKADVIYKELL